VADPTTVGELAILLTSMKESMERQFASITTHLEKLDGLPMKVQALEHRVSDLEQRALDRRVLAVTVLGWVVAVAIGILGLVVS
jgi:hypothetical protein